MKPTTHLFSVLLFTLLGLYYLPGFTWIHAFWLFIGGFGIDFDYYLFYVYTTKNYNLKKVFHHYYTHKKDNHQLRLFHTIEFITIMIISTHYLTFTHYLLIGMSIHLLMDWFDLIIIKKRYTRRYWFTTNWLRENFKTS